MSNSAQITSINFTKIKNTLALNEFDLPILGEQGLNALMHTDLNLKLEDVFFCYIAPEQAKPLKDYINGFSRPEEREFLNDYVNWRTNAPRDCFSYSPVRITAALHHLEKVDMYLTYRY